jgi:hypothetical protein
MHYLVIYLFPSRFKRNRVPDPAISPNAAQSRFEVIDYTVFAQAAA